jgi:MFS family permease
MKPLDHVETCGTTLRGAGERAPRSRADRVVHAVAGVFALNGVMMGASVARVPALRDQVGASPAQLGLALVAVGVGSLLAMPWTGRLVRRWGSAQVVRAAALLTAVGWSAVGLSGSVPSLGVLLLVTGAGIGVWDVAMNVQGHRVEQRDGRSWMPRLHAAFSAGAVLGAGLAALAVTLGAGPALQFAVVSVILAAGALWCVRLFLPDAEDPTAHGQAPAAGDPDNAVPAAPRRSLWSVPAVLVLGVVMIGTAFGEGAANDWLALMLVDTREASQSLAALAYAGFNAAMLTGRLVGGPAIERWGRARVLRVCGATAAAGVLLLCLVPFLPVALIGAMLWGVGLSVVFPAAISAAGEIVPGRGADAIAVVSTIGYGGFLLGPPLLGLLADAVALDRALLLVAVLAALISVLAGIARERPAEAPVAR